MKPLNRIDFEFWNDSVGPYSPVPDLILPSNPFARNALVEALRKDANYLPRRGLPRVQRFVLFLGSHSGSTEADPCLFRRGRGGEFLETRIVPELVEHRIKPEQRGSQRHV